MSWPVPADWDGERADRVLAHLAGVPRPAAKAALEEATVVLDGHAVAPRHRVTLGQVFTGEIEVVEEVLEPEPVDFGVAYEDAHLAVVDKPTGVVTHPGAGRRTGTLAAGVLHRWPGVRGVGAPQRWGIVHRLDRDTSGLLAVALTADAHAGLSDAIRRRDVEREYLCLVVGEPPAATGTIDAAIGRDPRQPTRMRIDRDGRSAVTHYGLEETRKDGSILRVRLETGRTHQIRVHLASIGLPVAGDRVYGQGRLSDRVFLHSTRIAFDHPIEDARIDVSSDLPEDLRTALDRLG